MARCAAPAGDLQATVRACATVDKCVKELLEVCKEVRACTHTHAAPQGPGLSACSSACVLRGGACQP